jgi:hypothetical protein
MVFGTAINPQRIVYIVSFNPYYGLSGVAQVTLYVGFPLLHDRINSCQKLRF